MQMYYKKHGFPLPIESSNDPVFYLFNSNTVYKTSLIKMRYILHYLSTPITFSQLPVPCGLGEVTPRTRSPSPGPTLNLGFPLLPISMSPKCPCYHWIIVLRFYYFPLFPNTLFKQNKTKQKNLLSHAILH